MEKRFNQCPNCGSKERFLESLVEEVKKQGYAREDWKMGFDFRQGVVIDQTREAIVPIGAQIPSYRIFTDICLDCGTIYAISIESGTAAKRTVPPKIIRPFGSNNPGFSNFT